MADDPWAKFKTDVAPQTEDATAANPTLAADDWSRFRQPTKPVTLNDQGKPLTRIYVSPKDYTKEPDAGVIDAVTRGAAQGGTFGFADELKALSAAGGGGPHGDDSSKVEWTGEHINGIQHLIGGLVKYMAGDPEAKRVYDEEVEKERTADKSAEAHHGIGYGTGQVGGVLATLPIGGVEGLAGKAAVAAAPKALSIGEQLAAVGGRAWTAAKSGAAYGALQGAGDGEGAADTVKRSAIGGAAGGVLAGVGMPLLEGAGALIKKGTEKAVQAYRGLTNPEGEGARQILTAQNLDRTADPTFRERMHPSEFNADPNSRVIDLGGNYSRRLADVSGVVSPGGEMKLKGAIDDRFKGQTARLSDWFRSHFNYPDRYQTEQALDQVAKTVNRPAYKAAYAEGDKSIQLSNELMSSPKVVSAMKSASESGKDRAVTEGYGAFNPGVTVTPDGRVVFNKGPTGVPTYPNLQFWDQTRRELSQAAQKAARSGANEDADVYGKLARKMNDELDGHVASYKSAREGAAGFFGAENAHEAGINFVMSDKIGLSEARAQLAKMTPAERRLFQDGFVDKFIEAVIGKTRDGENVLNKINQNPNARAKLQMVMPADKYAMLEAKLRIEGIFDKVRTAVQGQSITAKRLYDLGMAGGAGYSSWNHDSPTDLASGAIVALMSAGGKHINAKVASKIVDMMLSHDASVVQQGFKYLSTNPRWLEALRNADSEIGRVLSNRAPTTPFLQAAGVARADDQPGAPRPPGK